MDFQKIIDYAKGCLVGKYADFSGRARRAEYWSFTLCVSAVSLVFNLLYNLTGSNIFTALSGLVSLAVLVPGLAVGVRRLHDIGKKGTWYLIGLIPIVGWIILIVWFCKEGEPGANQFGPDPKLYD